MDTFKGGKSIAVRLFYFGVLTNAVKDTSFEEKKPPCPVAIQGCEKNRKNLWIIIINKPDRRYQDLL